MTLKYPLWQNQYLQAMAETRSELLKSKVGAAEQVVRERLRQLASTTDHANSASQGISRFSSCVLQSGVEIPYRAIKTNIADSLDVVVQIERRPGRRYISEVFEIRSYDSENDK